MSFKGELASDGGELVIRDCEIYAPSSPTDYSAEPGAEPGAEATPVSWRTGNAVQLFRGTYPNPYARLNSNVVTYI